MPHTSSKENRGRDPRPKEMVYDEGDNRFVSGVRLRKRVGMNFHYRKDRRGWKYGSKRSLRVRRQWARHKRGVGQMVARRNGGHPPSTLFVEKEDSWEVLRCALYELYEDMR